MRKKVTLQSLRMLNFKGFREFEVSFNPVVTTISGRNGTGKSSVFDAFTWLLFGKSSDDRKVFNVKTLDANGTAIPRIPHEVAAVLIVDDKTVTLRRTLNEKWVKRRGAESEEFTGHEECRYYNDVPCSVKEWNEKIASICHEEVFKFITNPHYFVSQKADVQRKMLFEMAGDISYEQIADSNPAFRQLLASLDGKTLEEYSREMAAKKRKVKEEVDRIPERIDERKRAMPDEEDWGSLEDDMTDKRNQLSQIDAQLLDEAEASKADLEARSKMMEQYNATMSEYNEEMAAIINKVNREWLENQAQRSNLENVISNNEKEIARKEKEIVEHKEDIKDYECEKDKLRKKWYDINAEQLHFDENEFVCPTCGRPLEADDIDRKRTSMIEAFNTKKAQELRVVNIAGKSFNDSINEHICDIDNCNNDINALRLDIEDAKAKLLRLPKVDKPDPADAIESSDKLRMLKVRMETILAEAKKEYNPNDNTELKEQRNNLQLDIERIAGLLAKKNIIRRDKERIAELENHMQQQVAELTAIERTEYLIAEFNKTKVQAVEDNINSLFKIVKFKMFDRLINDAEVEVCEATVNGVPYSDCNKAKQINAGLDIINAICTFKQITAPIFIDNRESVNDIVPMNSQVINLVVSNESELTIK